MKQYFAFQWHITDDCDQRCKHCYIFAENTCKQLDPFHFGSAPAVRLLLLPWVSALADEVSALADVKKDSA